MNENELILRGVIGFFVACILFIVLAYIILTISWQRHLNWLHKIGEHSFFNSKKFLKENPGWGIDWWGNILKPKERYASLPLASVCDVCGGHIEPEVKVFLYKNTLHCPKCTAARKNNE